MARLVGWLHHASAEKKHHQTHRVPRLGTDGTLHPGLQDQQHKPKQMIYSNWKEHVYWLIWLLVLTYILVSVISSDFLLLP